MRVTESMRVSSVERALTTASEAAFAAEVRASSGVRVSKPSDDPAAFARIAGADAALAKLDARGRALSQASSDAELAEGTLASAADLLASARDIALQLGDGAFNASDRAAAAKQVTELRQALVGLANTKGASGYLFGGTASGAPPFDVSGNFTGNDQPRWVEASDQVPLRADVSGAAAFTALGGRDVLLDLADLATALATDDIAGIGASIDALGRCHAQVVGARSSAGSTLVRLASASDVTEQTHLLITRGRAKDHDADAIEAYSALAATRGALSRSLEISRRVFATLTAEGA